MIITVWKDKAFIAGDFLILRTYAMELPGFKKFVGEKLMIELSHRNIGYLSNKPEIEWSGESKKYLEEYLTQAAHEKRLLENSKSILVGQSLDYHFKTAPFDHQLKALMLSCEEEYYGLFMEMGTGKTKVIIDNGAYLYERDKIDCLIILAPNGVHAQWIDEQVPLHLPDTILCEKAIYRASSTKSIKELETILNSNRKTLKIVSFNIDALSSKKGVNLIHKFLSKYRCLFAIDESTRIKTPGALRTKNALALAPLAVYRRIMSGAPITNGYEGLYAQFKFLSPHVLGFNSFYSFRNYFCIMGGFEGREIVGYKPNARAELETKVAAFTFRITKEECLTLPEKIYIKRFVELTSEQADIYDKLEEDLLTELNGAIINTPITLTKMLRMQQVVCGHIVDEDKKIHDIHSNRLDVLMEVMEEATAAGSKVIVWSRFVHDIHKISKRFKELKIKHVLYYGEISQQDREANIQYFKANPDCHFLGNQSAGGTGLNLAEADYMIYYSNDFNADTRWQSEARAHRIGQKKNVTYIDLVAKGTTDVETLAALRNKKGLADALLDDPRNFIKRRKDG